MKLSELKIKKRIMHSNKIDPILFENIKKYGMLMPIQIRENGYIWNGWERYKVAKALGWSEVEVLIVK